MFGNVGACRPGPAVWNERSYFADRFADVEAALCVVGDDGFDVIVQPPQQLDQHLSFALIQARQQSAFALQGCDNHSIVDGATLCRQRDRMRAPVAWIGTDCQQPAALQSGQSPANGSFIKSDDLADSGGRNARLDRKQRHDPPLRDVDAELPLIEGGRAVRQLVCDEGDEGWHIAIEVECRPFRYRRKRPPVFGREKGHYMKARDLSF